MTQHPVAAIDLGTNTARLLIARPQSADAFEPLLIKRWITRLGGGFTREQGISPDAKERTVAAVRDFAGEIERHGVQRLRGVATSAVRDAVNGESFCNEILIQTGIAIETIGSEEEGLLTLRGVLAGLDDTKRDILVFDVGGGSTEYTLTVRNSPVYTHSLPLGVVRLTEGKGSRYAIEEKISRELMKLKTILEQEKVLHKLSDVSLVGTAGTATSLAAMSLKMTEYDYRRVNNLSLSYDEIRDIFTTLLPMSPEQRLQIPGLEKGREDLIVAGILITLATMETFGFDQLHVSDFGLLEGLLLSIESPISPRP